MTNGLICGCAPTWTVLAQTCRSGSSYIVHWEWPKTSLRPVAILDDGVLVCEASGNQLCRCILQTQKLVEVKDKLHMKSLEYYNVEMDTIIEYPWRSNAGFDVIPYVPSLVQSSYRCFFTTT